MGDSIGDAPRVERDRFPRGRCHPDRDCTGKIYHCGEKLAGAECECVLGERMCQGLKRSMAV